MQRNVSLSYLVQPSPVRILPRFFALHADADRLAVFQACSKPYNSTDHSIRQCLYDLSSNKAVCLAHEVPGKEQRTLK